tara:strand:+ start:5905 stop:6558 length:654 start_codon:yes stop_codon:yes gene_type:complete
MSEKKKVVEVTITQEMKFIADSYGEKFVVHNKSAKEFGNHNSIRTLPKRTKDAINGKLGELVFACYAKRNYGVTVVLDNELRFGDNGDLGCNDIESVFIHGEERVLIPSVDVKSSQPNSRWLLVERHMFKASLYIMALLSEGVGTLVGWCHRSDFYNKEGQLKYAFDKGDEIPNTGVPLQAKNVALRIDELNNDWEKLFMIIKGCSMRREFFNEANS